MEQSPLRAFTKTRKQKQPGYSSLLLLSLNFNQTHSVAFELFLHSFKRLSKHKPSPLTSCRFLSWCFSGGSRIVNTLSVSKCKSVRCKNRQLKPVKFKFYISSFEWLHGFLWVGVFSVYRLLLLPDTAPQRADWLSASNTHFSRCMQSTGSGRRKALWELEFELLLSLIDRSAEVLSCAGALVSLYTKLMCSRGVSRDSGAPEA